MSAYKREDIAQVPTDQTSSTHVPVPYNIAGFVKVAWVAIAVYTIGLFIAGIPARYSLLLNTSPEANQALAQINLTPESHAILLISIEVILMLGFAVIGIGIFAQKPHDIAILVVTLSFVTFGSTILFSIRTLAAAYPELATWVRLAKAISWSLTIPIFYLFPNGRFEPKWTKNLTIVWLVWTWSWFFFPNLPHNPAQRGAFADPVIFPIYLAWFLSGVFAQTYRYRKVASHSEQQQTKWIVFGFSTAVIGTFLEELPSALNPSLMEDTPAGIIYVLISTTFFVLAVLSVPVSFALSIQRKRLWQIDYVINRSLVYGMATVLLGLAFFGIVLLLQDIFESVTGGQQSTIAIAASALLIAGLFQPIRSRLQIFIDQKLYGIHIRYEQERAPKVALSYRMFEQRERIGEYVIIDQLGRGGMAEIFKGEHLETHQQVAIKILLPPLAKREEFQQRFAREAQTVAGLNHPNIVKVFDYGEVKNTLYIIMEYVSQSTLNDLIAEKKSLDIDQVIHTVSQIADALDYAHNRGIVHRDIKPSNVLLRNIETTLETRLEPILTDFGIAKLLADGTKITKTGIVGTFDYIAPEQIQGIENVDGRADIYAMGIMVYQMLTGELPYPSGNPGATLIAHLQQPPPNPQLLQPELSAQVAYSIMKALAKNPNNRFSKASIFADALIE